MTIIETTAIGGTMLGLLGLIYKMAFDNDKKINRAYQRLDEVKTTNDIKYRGKEVCDVLHTQLREDIVEIKMNIKELLKRNMNG